MLEINNCKTYCTQKQREDQDGCKIFPEFHLLLGRYLLMGFQLLIAQSFSYKKPKVQVARTVDPGSFLFGFTLYHVSEPVRVAQGKSSVCAIKTSPICPYGFNGFQSGYRA